MKIPTVGSSNWSTSSLTWISNMLRKTRPTITNSNKITTTSSSISNNSSPCRTPQSSISILQDIKNSSSTTTTWVISSLTCLTRPMCKSLQMSNITISSKKKVPTTISSSLIIPIFKTKTRVPQSNQSQTWPRNRTILQSRPTIWMWWAMLLLPRREVISPIYSQSKTRVLWSCIMLQYATKVQMWRLTHLGYITDLMTKISLCHKVTRSCLTPRHSIDCRPKPIRLTHKLVLPAILDKVTITWPLWTTIPSARKTLRCQHLQSNILTRSIITCKPAVELTRLKPSSPQALDLLNSSSKCTKPSLRVNIVCLTMRQSHSTHKASHTTRISKDQFQPTTGTRQGKTCSKCEGILLSSSTYSNSNSTMERSKTSLSWLNE